MAKKGTGRHEMGTFPTSKLIEQPNAVQRSLSSRKFSSQPIPFTCRHLAADGLAVAAIGTTI